LIDASVTTSLHPKKLLLGKWTATQPLARDKHFIVVEVVLPEPPEAPVEWIEIEAVMSKRRHRIRWRDLRDPAQWRQGWT
jgi:tryptophan-rich hypothetical protein